ncbi:uncharacterized protein [Chironomus tepperi]|uniref:uncharacterized protein n=1 Tax=Chironomus tepperi TaxID=113505 RepID=UPI00391F9C40
MNKAKILILLLAISASTNAIDVNCNFMKAVFGGSNILTCFANKVEESINSPEPDEINIVNKCDLPDNTTLEDVEGIYSKGIEWPRFPINLWKKLPKLKAIEMDGAGLENLRSTYFFNLTGLVHLGFPRNKFTQLQGRLFRHCPGLKWIRFNDNPDLVNIGFNLFGNLPYLKEINFGGIGCGEPDDTMKSTDSSMFSKIASRFLRACPPDEEDLADDMENMECTFKTDTESESKPKGSKEQS